MIRYDSLTKRNHDMLASDLPLRAHLVGKSEPMNLVELCLDCYCSMVSLKEWMLVLPRHSILL